MGLGYKFWNRAFEETRAEEKKIKAELEAAGVRPTWKIESSHGFVEHNPKLPELRLMLQVSRLRSALEEYAKEENYDPGVSYSSDCYVFSHDSAYNENYYHGPWNLAQEALKDG